ncbi:MAG: hypothetical protein COA43_06955 [Robiginitomaculum sp.]|nr:MAG: hypothetical protein COA43_06955 [Robiginitomaculum sp.]
MAVRDTVMKSLRAIGSSQEASFYTKIFQQQDPERFALIVVDPRCLKNPLLESLVSDLKILSDLDLTPVLLVGALDNDQMSVRYQAQRLSKALETAHISNSKLNCASYEFMNAVRKIAHSGRVAILEMIEMERSGSGADINLQSLVRSLRPNKVIFLQPSGGFRVNGQRIPVVNIDQIDDYIAVDALSDGQNRFIEVVKELADDVQHHCTYVIASPLNLLSELFTVRGAGTMLRRGAKINKYHNYKKVSKTRLSKSIESTFGQPLVKGFFDRPVTHVFVEEHYRGGAIVMEINGTYYLSKFWVTQEAQGEGIARDIWQEIEKDIGKFYWRSKRTNPFNHWYMKMCDGMQVSGAWRVFWKGLKTSEIANAITAASDTNVDFEA